MTADANRDPLVPDDAVAPPAKGAAWIYVVQSGLLTTALALGGVWWLSRGPDGANVMGTYANYVIPVGAIGVGLVAGGGYGLSSWYAGVRVDGRLLATVAGLLFAAYFAAQYVEFRSQGPLTWQATGEPVTFPAWFHENTMSFSWKPDDPTDRPSLGGPKLDSKPMGKRGYVFVALGIAGFVGGGLISPLALLAVPYCAGCGRYRKTRRIGTIAASVPVLKGRKLKRATPDEAGAYLAAQQSAGESAAGQVERLMALASAGDGGAFRAEAAPAVEGRKANGKLPRRVDLSLSSCPRCGKGMLKARLATGHGQQQSTVDLASTDVTPEFTAALDDRAATV